MAGGRGHVWTRGSVAPRVRNERRPRPLEVQDRVEQDRVEEDALARGVRRAAARRTARGHTKVFQTEGRIERKVDASAHFFRR